MALARSANDRVRSYLATVTSDNNYDGYDTPVLRQVTFVGADVEQKATTFKFVVEDFMSNLDGNLHGGAASTIFDNLTSTALFTIGKPGFWDNLGVSRSLSVVFHRPLPLGTSVVLRCRVVSAGRRLTHLEAVMETANGKVCASCIHEKVRVEVPTM
ncbi:hypothetical protein CLAIMM_12409 [Cladophialophora immunda]|nr:hypothetical protein CLAIMM_12409 [Cladophialophora immunda]